MDGQRRAAAGGEIGANGEWYSGGTFVATSKQTIKSAPLERHAVSPEQEQRRRDDAARAASIAAWLERRRAELDDVIARLTACPADIDPGVWAQRVADHAAGFEASMGRTLWAQGSVSARQAVCIAKALIGRRTQRTADVFDALVASLREEWRE